MTSAANPEHEAANAEEDDNGTVPENVEEE